MASATAMPSMSKLNELVTPMAPEEALPAPSREGAQLRPALSSELHEVMPVANPGFMTSVSLQSGVPFESRSGHGPAATPPVPAPPVPAPPVPAPPVPAPPVP